MELPVSDDNRDVHTIFEDLPRVSYKNILRPKINHILGFYVEEFKRLLSGTWLQENTINNYFKLLQKETMQMLFLPTPHLNEGADFMERSMRDVDKYGAYPKLFLPLNINGSHWILYVIDNQSRTIKTLDSLSKKMKSNKKVCAESLAQIVAYYAANGYNITDYALQTGDICPQQPDYSNCGVCVILNAQFMLDGGRLNYPHKKRDFIIYRQAIACSLLTGTLM
jgi:Ulp1 family protease